MKTLTQYFGLVFFALLFLTACDDDSSNSLKGEVWPKEGYLFTRNYDLDTVYVESVNFVVTSYYSPKYPIDDNAKKWKISTASGGGVYIHNDQGKYWTIDSAFHPGLRVEQHFISIASVTDKSKLTNYNKFKYHKSGDGKTFYIESGKFPDFFVHATGHAESGRGLILKNQNVGTWAFWIDNE